MQLIMSKRRETAIEVMDAFKAWDIERVMAYRAENCTQQVVPSAFLLSCLLSLKRKPLRN